MIKLNMGCGHRKLAGNVNVDAVAACEPDEVFDLESTPWPWADGCAEEVRFVHSLEHMGADPKVFLAMMQQLYRVAADGCLVRIDVPHRRHDNFIGGGANTPLAHYTGASIFETVRSDVVVDEPYYGQFKRGELSRSDLQRLLHTSYNIAREFRITLRARKSAWSPARN